MAGVHPSVSNYSLTNPKEADLELHPTTFAEPPRCYPPVSSWEITELNGCLNTFWGVLYFIVKGPNVSPAMCLIKVDGQQSSSIDPLERISDLEVRPFLELPMDQLNNIQLSKHAGYRWMVIVCQRHFRYHWIKSYNKIISIYIAIFVVLHMLHQNKNTFAGRPPPLCTWIQCLQGQPPSGAKLCVSRRLGQWRDSTFHGPKIADPQISWLWKLGSIVKHRMAQNSTRQFFCNSGVKKTVP